MASIIFGWYSTKIKSYTPQELELDNSHPDYQVRQRIFHIMYIPIIPIGKVYVFKQDHRFYKAPENIKQQIKARKKHRTPWYALIVPTLVVLGGLLAGSVYFYTEWKDKHRADEQYAIAVAEQKQALDQLTENTYIRLENTRTRSRFSCFLKVEKVSGNQVDFLKWQSTENNSDYIHRSAHTVVIDFFQENADSLERVSIPLEKLKNMIVEDRLYFHDYIDYELGEREKPAFDKSVGENLFNDGDRYVIEGIFVDKTQ